MSVSRTNCASCMMITRVIVISIPTKLADFKVTENQNRKINVVSRVSILY